MVKMIPLTSHTTFSHYLIFGERSIVRYCVIIIIGRLPVGIPHYTRSGFGSKTRGYEVTRLPVKLDRNRNCPVINIDERGCLPVTGPKLALGGQITDKKNQ